jgi:hypothetical protein
MRIAPSYLLTGATLLFVAGLTLQACTSSSAPPAESTQPAAEAAPTFHADYSIREVMTYMVDPLSDFIFDAVGSDITAKGIVDIKPTTDEDWANVMRGAVSMVEGANLLKIRRPVAPAHENVSKNPGELHPDEIQALIDKSPGVWNAYVDGLRNEGLKVAEIVKAKDVERLTLAGSELDKVCEACHLTFWYPGDREAVERDRKSRVFQAPQGGQGR